MDVGYPYAFVANSVNGVSVIDLSPALAGNGGQLTNLNAVNISGNGPPCPTCQPTWSQIIKIL